MKHVYLLESLRKPTRRYRGLTDNVDLRLKRHNDGEVPSTKALPAVAPGRRHSVRGRHKGRRI